MLLDIESLSKSYGHFLALDNINISLNCNEIIGFLGVNGAGKSTLMNILAGYLAPSSGIIRFNNHDFLDNPIHRKKAIGYLPEQPPLYLEMTVLEYLNFVGEIRLPRITTKERRNKICEIMEHLSLRNMSSRLIQHLSKGYKQRLGIAYTLIGNPALLIWDEPTAGLDPQQLHEMHVLLRKFKENHTILLSSHIMHEIESICDRIIVIDRGKIIANSTTQELKNMFHTHHRIMLEIDKIINLSELNKIYQFLPHQSKIVIVSQTSSSTQIHITLPDNHQEEDGRKLVWQIVKKQQWDLLSFSTQLTSLEESFLKLTRQQKDLPQ